MTNNKNKISIPQLQHFSHIITRPFKAAFSRIGFKLILLILLVLALAMGSLILLSTRLVTEFGEYSAAVNEKHIKEKTALLLSRLMDDQTQRYEEVFNKIALSSAVIAHEAGVLMDHRNGLFRSISPQIDLTFYPTNQFFSNKASDPIQILYWGETIIPEYIRNELPILSKMTSLLVKIKESSPESAAAYVVTESNLTLYYPNVHFVEQLKPIDEYDLKQAVWYRMANPAENPDRKTVWTKMYQDEAGQGLMITAVTPIYSINDEFLGVAGVDVTLKNMIEGILINNSPTGDPKQMSGMFSFIVNADGSIVAFPTENLTMFGLPPKKTDIGYGDVLELTLLDSEHESVKKIGKMIISHEKLSGRIDLSDTPILISSQVIPSTGWHLCIAIPESYVLSSVEETRAAIGTLVKKMNDRFQWITIIFLLFCALIIIIFLSRQLIAPLNRLILGAGRVKEGDLTIRLEPEGNDEMGQLTQTFNTMVAELYRASCMEKEYTRTLERDVKKRTRELFEKNKEQAHTLELLEKESRERNAIQERLLESEEKYRDMFENAVEGIFQSTPDNRLLNANPALARIWGYDSPEEMMTELDRIEDVYLYPEERKRFVRLIEENRTVSGFEMQGIKKDGTRIWTSLSARAVVDDHGKLLYFLGSIEEITERKQAEEAIRKASEMAKEASLAKSRFLATMSHEIRTPMNAVIGMADLMLTTPLTIQQKKYLDTIHRSSEHLLSLIDDILDISAIEAKRIDLSNAPFYLDTLLKEVVDMFQATAREKAIDLSYGVGDDVPAYLYGDAARLRQILVNLINNALKFTHEGRIRIMVGTDAPLTETEATTKTPIYGEENTIRFSISDTGIGIPEESMEHIFEEFNQLESSLSRQYGGSGLGLAICRKLVDLMGGRIWVDSEVYKGSAFHFSIPLGSLSPDDAMRPSESSNVISSSVEALRKSVVPEENPIAPMPDDMLKKYHILLAEDFEVNREVITPILEQHGFGVTIAVNGKEAVKALRENDFDLVLMDIQMPLMDGLEAAKMIRTLDEPHKAKIPIIALTAHALKGDRERFIEAGMDDYLPKPVRAGELIQAISKLLVSRKSVGKNFEALPVSHCSSLDSSGSESMTEAVTEVLTDMVNFEVALELADNDSELLLITCNAIAAHLPGKLSGLVAAVENRDFPQAARLAHSIKTAAKSVGAKKTFKLSSALEQAGIAENGGQAMGMDALLPPLTKEIKGMLTVITAFIHSQSADGQPS